MGVRVLLQIWSGIFLTRGIIGQELKISYGDLKTELFQDP
jgi:hypothetical protein